MERISYKFTVINLFKFKKIRLKKLLYQYGMDILSNAQLHC